MKSQTYWLFWSMTDGGMEFAAGMVQLFSDAEVKRKIEELTNEDPDATFRLFCGYEVSLSDLP